MAFDTMAFNEAELGNMGSAIDTYIADVNSHMDKIAAHTVNAEDGFYGAEQANTVDNYIAETCTQIKSIVLFFEEFRDKLTEVQAAYNARQASISTGEVAAAPTNDGDLVNVKPFN